MGFALALIMMGVLIFLDRAGIGYGVREGWPWVVVALGVGGVLKNRKSIMGWITTLIGIFILGSKYYSLHLSIPRLVRTYFLPLLLMAIGFFWLLRHKKD